MNPVWEAIGGDWPLFLERSASLLLAEGKPCTGCPTASSELRAHFSGFTVP